MPESQTPESQTPTDQALRRMENYVAKYRQKTGTSAHPNSVVTDAIVNGLARNVDELGRPLCPCNFYPTKQRRLPRVGVGYAAVTR